MNEFPPLSQLRPQPVFSDPHRPFLYWFPMAAKRSSRKLGGLKREIYSFVILGARCLKSACWQDRAPSGRLGEHSSLPLGAPDVLGLCLHLCSILPPSSHGFPSVCGLSPLLSPIRTLVITFGTHTCNSG